MMPNRLVQRLKKYFVKSIRITQNSGQNSKNLRIEIAQIQIAVIQRTAAVLPFQAMCQTRDLRLEKLALNKSIRFLPDSLYLHLLDGRIEQNSNLALY